MSWNLTAPKQKAGNDFSEKKIAPGIYTIVLANTCFRTQSQRIRNITTKIEVAIINLIVNYLH